MAAIPKRLIPEFIGHMEAYEDDDLPDGAWFAKLENGADEFIRKHRLRCDANSAVHQFLKHR